MNENLSISLFLRISGLIIITVLCLYFNKIVVLDVFLLFDTIPGI